MSKQIVATAGAPAAIGPYSQAVAVGEMIFCSGQIPLTPAGELVTGDTAAQCRQVLDNLRAVLEAAGSGLHEVVKTTIFCVDLGEFATINEIYGGYFTGRPPARATVQVAALPRGARVEIEAVAVRGS